MCVFCEIIKRKLPAHIVYENEQLISFLDIEPINEGHVLLISMCFHVMIMMGLGGHTEVKKRM